MTDLPALLARLIGFDTRNPGGDETALAAFLSDALRARGADAVDLVEVLREDGRRGAYVYARFGEPQLLVNAHIDTVPANAGWSSDPHQARRRDGRVVGLGAADTKGAIAAILAALEHHRPRGVGVLFSGDEELAGTCARAFLAGPHAAGLRRAIVCEPTSLRVGTRHRGIFGLTATVEGPGGHSSRADAMVAPVADLARLAVALDDWGRAHRGRGPRGFEGMCTNIARIEGGVAFNVVPTRATLTVSVRPPPGADAAAVRDELVALASAACPAARLATLIDQPPFATREAPAFARWLGDRSSATTDLGFWTEAAVFVAAGIDAVVFGPGDIAQAHAADEWVSEGDLEAARDVFAGVFQASAEGTDGTR